MKTIKQKQSHRYSEQTGSGQRKGSGVKKETDEEDEEVETSRSKISESQV